MSRRRDPANDLCGPDCGYRSLYHGSQTSLADMAARQAEALGRHGRLRAAIIQAVRRTHPREFARTEQELHARLSDVDDQVLVPVVEGLLNLNPTVAADELAELRAALERRGVVLPDSTDLSGWAAAVDAGAPSSGQPTSEASTTRHPAAALVAPAAPAPPASPSGHVPSTGPTAPTGPSRPSLRDLAAARTATRPSPADLPTYTPVPSPLPPPTREEPEASTTPTPTSSSTPAPAPLAPAIAPQRPKASSAKGPSSSKAKKSGRLDEPPRDDSDPGFYTEMPDGFDDDGWFSEPSSDELNGLFDDDSGFDVAEPAPPVASPTSAADGWKPEPAATTPPGDAPEGDPSADPQSAEEPGHEARGDGDQGDDGFLSDAAPAPGGRAPRKRAPRRRPRGKATSTDATQQGSIDTDPATHPGPSPVPAQASASPRTPWDPPTADDELPVADDLSSLFDADPEPPIAAVEPTPEPDPTTEPAPAPAAVVAQPLRPTIFPQAAPTKGPSGRKRRSSRVAPEPPALSEGGGADGLDDTARAALEAMVALPRPVFISDLVASTGSDAKVRAWEEECRAMTTSPVKFLPPKQRHRPLGALVIPYDRLRKAAADVDNDWWAQAVSRYRAGRLYELAVLLQRVGDQVVSFRFEDEAALLRLAQPRGIVGVAVAMTDKLAEGDSGRETLLATIEELLRDRLSLLVVLSTFGEPIERLVDMLVSEAQIRNWQPSQQVVAARSWEYANGNNATFVHVLG